MQTDEKATGLEAGFSRDSLISACSYVLRWVVCDNIWIKPVSEGGSPADKKSEKGRVSWLLQKFTPVNSEGTFSSFLFIHGPPFLSPSSCQRLSVGRKAH